MGTQFNSIKTLQELAMIYTALDSINEHYNNCSFLLNELIDTLSYEKIFNAIEKLRYLDIKPDEEHIKLQRDLEHYHFSGKVGEVALKNYPAETEPRNIYVELYYNVKSVYDNQYGPNSLTCYPNTQ